MLTNLLLTFYRVTVRYPGYSLLNLLGLSLGSAVFIVLGLYVRFETSFESWISDADKIYLVATRWDQPGRPLRLDTDTMGGLLEELREDYSDLVGTRTWNQQATVHLGADVFHETEYLVDPDFFNVFDLELVAGDKFEALADPDKIVVTAAMARKYLGRVDAVGRTLRLSDIEGSKTYVVSAVVKDLPSNTDLNFDFVRLLTPNAIASQPYWRKWGAAQLETYLRFDEAAKARNFETGFDDFADRKGESSESGPRGPTHLRESFRLMNLQSVHLRDPVSHAAVVTMGLVGVLSFIVAAINFINLSTARAGMRAREVALRRTLGATRNMLRGQFIGEALITTLMALLIGFALVELALPIINAAGDLALSFDYRTQGPVLVLLFAAIIVLGLLSAVYPASVLSSYHPAAILASSRTPSGGKSGVRIRELLVVAQFSIGITFFILILGFVGQLDHMRTTNLGFQRDGLFVIPSTYDSGVTPPLLRTIVAALRTVEGVRDVTTSDSAPGDENTIRSQNVTVPGTEREQTTLASSEVSSDFFQTYGVTLLAGRGLDISHSADQVPPAGSKAVEHVVINARAARVLGFKTPEEAVDQTLYSGRVPLLVVGVIGDMRFHSLKEERKPAFYFFNGAPTENQIAAVRYEGVSEQEMRSRLTAAWKSVAPEIPLDLISADDNLDKYYRPDRNRSSLLGLGAMAAGLIGCIGLYGLAAFTTSRRLREVAVRKVLGASRSDVMVLLIGGFLRPVLLANAIAVPAGYMILRNWLLQFDDHIAIGVTPFLAAGAVSVGIAVITVSGLALRAAHAEPGKVLQYE